MIKCYDLHQLSMKFWRHVDAEVVSMRILGEDYSKLALLEADRSIELHAAYGKHFKVRVPRAGRDLEYNKASCELYGECARGGGARGTRTLTRPASPPQSLPPPPRSTACTWIKAASWRRLPRARTR